MPSAKDHCAGAVVSSRDVKSFGEATTLMLSLVFKGRRLNMYSLIDGFRSLDMSRNAAKERNMIGWYSKCASRKDFCWNMMQVSILFLTTSKSIETSVLF